MRALFQVIAADTHALASMRVGAYLKQRLGHDDAQVRAWQHHWIGQSFDALETLLSRDPSTGEFSHGDRPSLADIALVPQAHTAVATAWSSGHGRRSPAFPTPACACRPSRRPTPIMC
ncbi:glutathione S-transferase C-terminal domain-containing protein [Achromobacter xylosoxidans]